MKRTRISALPLWVPDEIASFAGGASIFDSSCSAEAKTYMIDKDEGYFLKCAEAGSLKREFEMATFFHKKGLGAEALLYLSGQKDFLLTKRVAGEDCTHPKYLEEPERLCDLLSERLRMLHEIKAEDCPVTDRTASYLALADLNYKEGRYDLTFAYDDPFESAKAAYEYLCAGRGALKNEVLLHGDYCLPNVILNDWRFSGFIDLGNGGIGDRHVDVFWGIWTLKFNLGTDRYKERFIDGYGRDLINVDTLRLIGAAEIFG